MKGDITQLNAFVKLTQDQLAAQGETTTDLLANLFKGYLTSQDKTFRTYIEEKQEDYDDGQVFTVEGLMQSAANKYKTLVENGKWMAPSSEESKILALQAKLDKMGKKSTSNQSTKSESSGKSNQRSTKSSNNAGGKSRRSLASWMTKYPGAAFVNANQYKLQDGKKYYWYKKHKRFTLHKTEECRKPTGSDQSQNNIQPSNTSSNNNASNSNSSYTPSLRVSTATMMNE